MKKIIKSILLLCLVVCFTPCKSQQLTFDHFDVSNGLSQNSVLSIAKDSRGFMWFGTVLGLNRYDGHHFMIFQNNPGDSTSLSNNYVTSLLFDSRKTLWVGTQHNLNKYNPEKQCFERITFETNYPKESNINAITYLHEDREGKLWVGTSNGLYLRTNRLTNKFERIGKLPIGGLAGNNIRCIYNDHENNLWVGTSTGLSCLTPKNGGYLFKTFLHNANNPVSISDNFVTSIVEDKQQNLWVGTQKMGLNLFIRSAQSFTRFINSPTDASSIVNNNIRVLRNDKSGKLWIGTQEGLSIMDPNTRKCISYQYDPGNKSSLSQNSIYSIYEDANASVWVGTYFGGVNIAYTYSTVFENFQKSKTQSSISNNVVSSVVADEKDNLWIGTEGGGLNFLNKATGLFTTYKNKGNDSGSLSSNLVKKVFIDKDGNIWAGTHGGGLNVLDPATHKFQRYLFKENEPAILNSEIAAILEDKSGRFWVGSRGMISGLKVFTRRKSILQEQPGDLLFKAIGNIYIRTLFEDAQKNIWAGTLGGLFILKQNATAFQPVVFNNSNTNLRNASINCIQQDAKGKIWFGVEYGGLNEYDLETGQLVTYTEKEGLPHNNIYGILEDEKHFLWISTGNGLARFDPVTRIFNTYNTSDGLTGNEFNYNSFYKDRYGKMYFGGFNGMTSFFPEKIETNVYAAPVVITGLKLFNNPVKIADDNHLLERDINFIDKLKFEHNQNVFTIEFALLNYIRSVKNRYAYKMDGFDKTWNEVTATEATYMNLPTGNYTFWVKGANNDGVWSEPLQLKITILPPVWKTWWAYCIYSILLGAIMVFVFRFFYLRALLKREEELHQGKLDFFTNISHEIRTHLTLIMAPVEKMLELNPPGNYISQQLTNVKSNANRLLKLVSEIMDFRKAEMNHLNLHIAPQNIIPFLEEIFSSFRELSLEKKIKMSFLHNTNEAWVYYDKEQMEKVLFNLLTNAFKFTPEGGHIAVGVESIGNKVNIKVTDNGRGIAPQYLEKLFTNFFQVADYGQQNTGYGIGLALSKNIVELHKGSITVESEPANQMKEGCTIFTVSLLKGNKHFEGSPFLHENVIEPKPVAADRENIQQLAPPIPLVMDTKEKLFTIQVIEDNREMRRLVKETFEAQYNIVESENGLAGWEAASTYLPDIIISDVMMPEMDGFTLCTKLKTDERTSHIPVILLTAKSMQSDQVAGLETGADMYVTKPFSTKVLELNVRNLLSSREKMRQKFSRSILAVSDSISSTPVSVEADFVNRIDKEFLEKVLLIIEEHLDDPEFGVTMLAKKVAMSQPVLYKKLKAVTNMTVNDFVKSLRLKKAAQLLLQKQLTVYEVAYAIGYTDRKYFSQEFKKQYGKTPSEFADSGFTPPIPLSHNS